MYQAKLREDGLYENRTLGATLKDGYIEIIPQSDGSDKLLDGTTIEYYVAPQSLIYNSDTLITWAKDQVFAEALIPHFAAFLDFANKANQASYNNFIWYANAVGLTDTANEIVDKMIELGANITKGE